MSKLAVSTDKNKLDRKFIHAFLTQSYWAEGRTFEQVQQSIEACTCFGLFKDGQQIGFARVLTDNVVFAYLMDVFISPEHQGQGYSRVLLDEVFGHPDFKQVGWLLKTKDAHGLYQKYGFTYEDDPKLIMRKPP